MLNKSVGMKKQGGERMEKPIDSEKDLDIRIKYLIAKSIVNDIASSRCNIRDAMDILDIAKKRIESNTLVQKIEE